MRRRKSSSDISVRDTPAMVKGSGNVRVAYSAKSAGSNFRLARSPEAPKMIRLNGSSTDGMASKSLAQRGEEPVGERVFAAGAEPGVERRGDGRRRHGLFYGILNRPAAFTRVVHPGLEASELGIGRQRV